MRMNFGYLLVVLLAVPLGARAETENDVDRKGCCKKEIEDNNKKYIHKLHSNSARSAISARLPNMDITLFSMFIIFMR